MKIETIRISSNEKIELISNLSTLLSAGIPILEAVDSLLEDSKGNLRKILEILREDISQGKRIYLSFSKFPLVFDKVMINIIKASEEAGTLETTLLDIRTNIKREIAFNGKIKSALVYPMFVGVIFTAIMILMLTFVIPKISSVFSRLNVTIPLPTKILFLLSNFLLTNTIPFLIGLVAFIIGVYALYSSNRKFFLGIFLSLPLISGLAKQIDLARFSHSLFLLLSAGIPITTALELTEDVVAKKNISKIIIRSKEMVSAGKKLSEGLKDEKNTIPTMIIKITEASEKSGTLDKAMQEISEFYDYQVSNSLERITVLMEPIILVVVGLAVGGIMISTIAPIYGLIGQISPH